MKKASRFLMVISCLFLLAAPSFATQWTDLYIYNNNLLDPLCMADGGANEKFSFTFDLTKDGFNPLLVPPPGFDTVISYEVSLYVSDDLSPWRDPLDRDGYLESLKVTTGYLKLFPETYEVDFNLLDPLDYDMNLSGLITLNTVGTLRLNLEATQGDFYFFGGKLTATDCKPVPEPATLLLLGAGLVGIAGYGRKKLR
jgi:hypothetical protein